MAGKGPLWRAGEAGEVLLYRINRRPIGQETLVVEDIPEDVLDHVYRMLPNGSKTETWSSSGHRIWIVGGVEKDEAEGILTGKLGWVPAEQEVITDYSDEAEDWVVSIESPHGRVVMPFAFDAATRVLAVLRIGRNRANTIAGVFETVLAANERKEDRPSTEWSVEAILDPRDFAEWLESLDVVREVEFVAKLPNPTPDPSFEEVFERMEARDATRFTQNFYSNKSSGLQNIRSDPEFAQAESMAKAGFANLRGTGERNGHKARYNQNERVARDRIEHLPDSWDGMLAILKDFLKKRARQLLNGQ
jgi:hypothetical protein